MFCKSDTIFLIVSALNAISLYLFPDSFQLPVFACALVQPLTKVQFRFIVRLEIFPKFQALFFSEDFARFDVME